MVGPISDRAVVKVILVEFGIIMFTAGRVMSQLEKQKVNHYKIE